MRIIIINLAHEKKRLGFQQKQLKKLGLAFERFEAITPQTLPENISEAYWQTWERPLRLEERACFLSHRNLWQSVADTNKPALILEDDVLLSNVLPEFLRSLDDLGLNPSDHFHMSLEVRNRKKLISSHFRPMIDGKVNIHNLYQDRSGAAAYILWPQGARKLLNHTQSKSGLADAIICRLYSLCSSQVEPALALQFDMCEHYDLSSPFKTISVTNLTQKLKTTSVQNLVKFKSRRILSQLRMGLRRLYKLSATRRKISLTPEDFTK